MTNIKTTALVCCSGVFQPPKKSNGAKDMAAEGGRLPHVVSFYRRHIHNPRKMAELIRALRITDVVMLWHSRGYVFSAACCEVLGSFGIRVRKGVSADGWDGFDGELTLPANFDEVESWTQDWDHPRGAKILLPPGSPTRLIEHMAPPGTTHIQVDELPAVRAAVLAAVKGGA